MLGLILRNYNQRYKEKRRGKSHGEKRVERKNRDVRDRSSWLAYAKTVLPANAFLISSVRLPAFFAMRKFQDEVSVFLPCSLDSVMVRTRASRISTEINARIARGERFCRFIVKRERLLIMMLSMFHNSFRRLVVANPRARLSQFSWLSLTTDRHFGPHLKHRLVPVMVNRV